MPRIRVSASTTVIREKGFNSGSISGFGLAKHFRILSGLSRGESDESPREITNSRTPLTSESGENGWLIRFFDSTFFCALVFLAELEDSDDNEGISRIQEKCQIAATLMGEWSPLVRPPNAGSSPVSKNQVLNRILSSKQRFLSLTSSPTQLSLSFSPSSGNHLQEDGGNQLLSPEENKIFKKFIPGSKVRDALLFRKSAEKDEEENEKDGFFKRLLRDSRGGEDEELTSSSDGFFKRLLRDSKAEEEEMTSSSEGFFKRLFRDSKSDSDDKSVSKPAEDDEKDGFFKKLFKDKFEDKKDLNDRIDDVHMVNSAEKASKSAEDEKEGFFRKFFKDKFEDKKDGNDKIDDGNANGDFEEKISKSAEDDEKEGFFRKLFKDKFEDKKDGNDDGEEEESSLFRRLFRVHPEENKTSTANESSNSGGLFESSPGTENFFRKLFRDRDRSIEDSELFSSKKHKESLAEINLNVAEAQNSGGVCFPMGKGLYRVVHIPEDEAVLLNSREKAPFLICVEVLKSELPSTKDTSNTQKLSRGGIPLANGDALLPKPPPWAYPLWTAQEVYRNSSDRMSSSTAQAIDQAMTHKSEAKVKFINVSFSVEKQSVGQSGSIEAPDLQSGMCCGNLSAVSILGGQDITQKLKAAHASDLEWVRVVLTADPGLRMEDIEGQGPPRRKEHRCVPSTVAIEEVKAAAAKGEAPPGLPLKGAGQDSSDAQPRANGGMPKAGDALSGELWEVKKERIRKASVYGKLPGWDLRSVIVKSGDDCRQEHLAVQLISHFYDIFQEAGLPLWLRPYEVLVTSSYTALIETIPDTASLHSIKSRYPNISSLREFYAAKYQENSPSFKLAQRNFVESMAGYSLVCYLLQVKDRHNGNLLLDEEGHIIHIDFGFMLSNSPGGVNFESAPFKLTRELLEVMDSDAEGVPSEFFDYFKVLCIQGFLTCRKHAERIILLVEMLQDSGFPCFKGGPRTIQNLRKRFLLSLTEEQCVSLVLSLISSSLDAWRTRQYDYYQRVLNGIL
ncbi:hypothetical protein CRYUN_Cryun22dG0055300 [Craigia yunnanensis]